MTRNQLLSSAVVVLTLSGCNLAGGNAADNAAEQLPLTPAERAETNARIEQDQGTAAAQGIDCAAHKPPTDTRRDILGISYGMSAEEAFAVLACANPAFKVRYSTTGGFETKPFPDGRKPRTLIEADSGMEKALVFLMGLPGQERVIAVHRDVSFGEGNEVPFDSILKMLVDKYGQPTKTDRSGNWHQFEVPHAPDGQLIGRDNPNFYACTHERALGPSMAINSGCGLSANFIIFAKESNPGLATRFKVAVVEQRKAMEDIAAINGQALAAQSVQRQSELDAARRAVEKAGSDEKRRLNL